MTPFAHAYAKHFLRPSKDFNVADEAMINAEIFQYHLFEVSDVEELANDLGEAMYRDPEQSSVIGFMPFPKIILEYVVEGGGGTTRTALLLRSVTGGAMARFGWLRHGVGLKLNWHETFISLENNREFGKSKGDFDPDIKLPNSATARIHDWPFVIGMLAIINTPKLIGRTEFPAHKGLAKLAKAASPTNSPWKPAGWSKILLHVMPPNTSEGNDVSFSSGKRALHDVRAHLRIRRGRVEFVRSHRRGDPEIGERKSSYKVKL